MLKFSVLAALRTRLQRGQHLLYLAILGAGAILLLGAAGGCDAQPVLPHRGYLPPSSASASSSYRGVTTRGGSSAASAASAANSRDLLELIRTRLLQRGGGGDVDDVDDVNELQEQRGFRNFDVPASQWLARRPYYQGALLGDREGGLSGEFSSELSRGRGADEEDDEEELKDDGMMMGMQQHKRGGSKQLAVGSEMEATARYLGGLSRRRKDAKHMIHTIESLMHIGK